MKSKTSFLPVFEVGVVNDEMPACRQLNTASLDPAMVAGMCVSIVDFVVSKVEDSKQIDFEKEMAKINMEHNDKQILRKIARASQPPRVIRNTIRREGRGKKTRLKIK